MIALIAVRDWISSDEPAERAGACISVLVTSARAGRPASASLGVGEDSTQRCPCWAQTMSVMAGALSAAGSVSRQRAWGTRVNAELLGPVAGIARTDF